MLPSRFPWPLALVICCLLGCKHGCTSREVLNQESKRVTLHNGTEIRLLASHTRYTNFGLRRGTSKYYALEHEILLPNGEKVDIDYTSLPKSESPELDEELERIEFSCSENGECLAYGLNGRIKGLINHYEGHYFYTDQSEEVKEKIWWAVDLDKLPSTEDMIREVLSDSALCILSSDVPVAAVLKKVPPEDQLHFAVLERVGECSSLRKMVSKEWVSKMKDNSEWKSKAIAKGKAIAFENQTDQTGDDLLSYIGDKKSLRYLDSARVANFLDAFGHGKRFVEASLDGRRHKLHPKAMKMFRQLLRETMDDWLSGSNIKGLTPKEIVMYWEKMGEEKELDRFLSKTFQPDLWENNYSKFAGATLARYEFYSKPQQKVIQEGAIAIMPHLRRWDKRAHFQVLREILDCKALVQIKGEYAELLGTIELPEDCR